LRMSMNTKDRILEAAIELFAEKGYSDVSIREITRAVGIKESSLYNHFISKQQILDEIFEYLKRQFDAMTMPETAVAEMMASLTPDGFIDMSVKSFESFLGNPLFVKIWRILSIERFTNPRARELFNRHFIDEPMRYQATVFQALMDRGEIPEQNPMLLAREFFSYILYIYFRYIEADSSVQLSENPEFRRMIKEHMEFLSHAFSKPI
jgi:AcrR family transcriptional regulator